MTFAFPSGFEVEDIQESVTPEYRGSRFSDNGPETRLVIGRNQFPMSFTVPFRPLKQKQLRYLTDFLRARFYRNQWFFWLHPVRGTMKVRCKSWGSELLGNGFYQLEAQFDQEFTL
jgi:hypothetical protein